MKEVYLMSGPRGSGKTTYANFLALGNPSSHLVNRDDICVELFGTTSLSPYTGGHKNVIDKMFDRLSGILSEESECTIILDCWNGYPSDRRYLVQRLQKIGADRVFCIQIYVSLKTCIKQCGLKKDMVGYSESGIVNDYRLYYKQAENIENDGFDGVFGVVGEQMFLPFES